MEYFSELGYIGIFIAAFMAATVLPLSSEVVLSAMLLGGWPPAPLIVVATTGNILGALTNYALGYWSGEAVIKRWLRLSDVEMSRAQNRFAKYGVLSLCLAWLPIIGDPLTVMAGILRVKLRWFLLLVSIGKCLRYVVVSYLIL